MPTSTPRRLPSLNALRAFETAARLGSITAAADELSVTASALSHQIKKLEEYLGLTLLDRMGNRIVPTREGALYVADLSHAFELMHRAHQNLVRRQSRQAIRVSTLPVFAIKWLMPRITEFYLDNPGVDIEIKTSYQVSDIRQTGDDISIRYGDGSWTDGKTECLFADIVQPVCSTRAWQAAGSPDRFWQQASRIQLSTSRDDWQLWHLAFSDHPQPAGQELRFTDPLASIQAAISGMGACIAPHALVSEELRSGLLMTPLDSPVQLQQGYHLVTHPEASLSESALRFVDWLKRAAQSYLDSTPVPVVRFEGLIPLPDME